MKGWKVVTIKILWLSYITLLYLMYYELLAKFSCTHTQMETRISYVCMSNLSICLLCMNFRNNLILQEDKLELTGISLQTSINPPLLICLYDTYLV